MTHRSTPGALIEDLEASMAVEGAQARGGRHLTIDHQVSAVLVDLLAPLERGAADVLPARRLGDRHGLDCGQADAAYQQQLAALVWVRDAMNTLLDVLDGDMGRRLGHERAHDALVAVLGGPARARRAGRA